MLKTVTKPARLLVVTREPSLLRPLRSIAGFHACEIETAVSVWDAMEYVQSGKTADLLLLDLPRGEGETLHILRWLHRESPDLPVVVVCFAEDTEQAREATRLGAQEVLMRPFDNSKLEALVSPYLAAGGTGQDEFDSEHIEQIGPDDFFVCGGPASQRLRAQAELLAEADVPVLIQGEAGTGKHTTARLIHKLSARSGFKFLSVNCANVPARLLEAQLFGDDDVFSADGSRSKGGIFERAEKGAIYLDEITEMPLELQERLMSVLQDKVLWRPGRNNQLPVDVRVMAATRSSLERAFAEGKLREDLYYRLSAFTISVLPLRMRRNEIGPLLRHSMHKLSRHFGLPPRDIPAKVLAACQEHAWPGNMRELEAFAKRYLLMGDHELSFDELDADLTRTLQPESPNGQETLARPAESKQSSGRQSLKSLVQNVKWEAEKTAIGTALQKTGWNRKAAARLLQVSYRTLLYKIDQHQMSASTAPLLSPEQKLSVHRPTFKGNATQGK